MTLARRLPVVALLLVLAVPPLPAAAQTDPYSATVTIDATSETVAKARDIARINGARQALQTIVANLAGGADKAKPLKLSDNQVTDMVASFEVANEKMSAVRYTADYTYHFKSADVAKVMQAAGISAGSVGSDATAAAGAAPAAGGKPVVVLPVYQAGDSALLWDDPNPWRDAWSQRPGGTSGTILVVPLGDVSDLAAIDADKARTGDSGSLSAIAKKEGADDVLVMIAVPRAGDRPGLGVTVRRYRGGRFVDAHVDSLDGKPNESESDLCRRAADTIAADIDNGWKNAKGGAGDQFGTLVVAAAISGLDDWLALRDRLAALPAVRKIDVKSLSRQEATIEIQYLGTLDDLKTALATAKLDLQGGDPTWRLAHADKP